MKLNPSTRLKIAIRAARRRRYGYAALRVLRRGLRAAVADHFERSTGRAPSRVRTAAPSRHAGGRPLKFIPTAVVERAVTLWDECRRWSEVAHWLEREGNGTYDRNTIRRRVEALQAVQNQPGTSSPAAAGAGGSSPVKTRPRKPRGRVWW